jgi:hypothetical protein
MTGFDTYGPWAALVAVSGLVGWAFRALLTAVLSSMAQQTEVMRAIHDEIRLGHADIRDDIDRLANPNGRPRRTTRQNRVA